MGPHVSVHLGGIFFLRENAPEHLRTVNIGQLFYDPGTHFCSLLLNAFRQGMCGCVPEQREDLPFLQGEVVQPVRVKADGRRHQFIGYITTSETAVHKTIYTLRFECAPLRSDSACELWLNVNLEDAHGRE